MCMSVIKDMSPTTPNINTRGKRKSKASLKVSIFMRIYVQLPGMTSYTLERSIKIGK